MEAKANICSKLTFWYIGKPLCKFPERLSIILSKIIQKAILGLEVIYTKLAALFVDYAAFYKTERPFGLNVVCLIYR